MTNKIPLRKPNQLIFQDLKVKLFKMKIQNKNSFAKTNKILRIAIKGPENLKDLNSLNQYH